MHDENSIYVSADERRLVADVFKSVGSDFYHRPVANNTDSLLILLGINLKQIVDVVSSFSRYFDPSKTIKRHFY